MKKTTTISNFIVYDKNNTCKLFYDNCVKINTNYKMSKPELYNAYNDFCIANELVVISKIRFYQYISLLNVAKITTINGYEYIKGIELIKENINKCLHIPKEINFLSHEELAKTNKKLSRTKYNLSKKITFDISPYNKTTPACVYVAEFYNDNEKFYKIGISTYSIFERFKTIPYKLSKHKELFVNLSNALIIEKYLLTLHQKYQYIPNIYFGGNTECFYEILKNEVSYAFSIYNDNRLKDVVMKYINLEQ